MTMDWAEAIAKFYEICKEKNIPTDQTPDTEEEWLEEWATVVFTWRDRSEEESKSE